MASKRERLARGMFRVGKGVVGALPERLRKTLDDRLFYAIFQVTRVTNDAYPQPEGSIPEPGRGDQGEPTTST